MPVLARNLSLTAGSTSVNPFEGTQFAFVNEGSEIRVSLASVNANDGVFGSDINYRFLINNTEFANEVAVPALVTGQPFGDNGAYMVNNVTATGQARNSPLLTITNDTGSTQVVKYFIFVSQQA